MILGIKKIKIKKKKMINKKTFKNFAFFLKNEITSKI